MRLLLRNLYPGSLMCKECSNQGTHYGPRTDFSYFNQMPLDLMGTPIPHLSTFREAPWFELYEPSPVLIIKVEHIYLDSDTKCGVGIPIRNKNMFLYYLYDVFTTWTRCRNSGAFQMLCNKLTYEIRLHLRFTDK
jgi:hypothetical protein